MTSTLPRQQATLPSVMHDVVFPPPTSQRYERLQTVWKKALAASGAHVNVRATLAAVYGAEGLAVFDAATLEQVFWSKLEQIETHVLERMRADCSDLGIPETLRTLESIALKLEKEAAWQQQMETADQAAAARALQAAKLPLGCQAADELLRYETHRQLAGQEAALQAELAQVHEEIGVWQAQEEQQTQICRVQQEKVAALAAEMETAADVTSTIAA
jgi:hypothetical protein